MPYLGQSLTEGTRRAYTFVATSGQTTFNAVYGVGAVDVFQNGILLQPSDYNSSSGSSVVLGVGAAVNDEITIIAHNTFSVADTVSSSQGGTFAGAVTASNGLTVDDDGATPLTVDRATNDGAIIDVQKDGSTVGSIGVVSGDAYIQGPSGHSGIQFNTNGVLPLRDGAIIDNTLDLGHANYRYKDLYLSGGAYIGGNGSANHLDDYEEGTWTPSFVNGGTLNILNAKYTKIGKLCYVGMYINNIQNIPNNSSLSEITGFPFAVSNTINHYHGLGTVSYVNSANWSQYDILGPTPRKGSNSCYFHRASGTASALVNSQFLVLNSKEFIFSLIFQTD